MFPPAHSQHRQAARPEVMTLEVAFLWIRLGAVVLVADSMVLKRLMHWSSTGSRF